MLSEVLWSPFAFLTHTIFADIVNEGQEGSDREKD